MADKNPLFNIEANSDVGVKLLDMIEKTAGWVVAPKGKKKDFVEGLAIYKKSIEDDPNLRGIEKGAKIASANKDLREYTNQASVIQYAIQQLPLHAKPEEVEEDWFSQFFEYVKNISNNSIQQMWGRILAEKCSGDTSINRNLLHILSLMDYKTSGSFMSLCRLTLVCPLHSAYNQLNSKYTSRNVPFVIPSKIIHPMLIKTKQNKKRNEIAIEYLSAVPSEEDLAQLEDLGLIKMPENQHSQQGEYLYPYNFGLVEHMTKEQEDGSFLITEVKRRDYVIFIGDSGYNIMPTKIEREEVTDPKNIRLGYVKYTTIGTALYEAVRTKPFEGLSDMLFFYLKSQGFDALSYD